MSEKSNFSATPANVAHARRVRRTRDMLAADALDLRSIRTASVRVHTSQSPAYEAPNGTVDASARIR